MYRKTACESIALLEDVGTVAVGTVAVGTVAVGTVTVGTVAVGTVAGSSADRYNLNKTPEANERVESEYG